MNKSLPTTIRIVAISCICLMLAAFEATAQQQPPRPGPNNGPGGQQGGNGPRPGQGPQNRPQQPGQPTRPGQGGNDPLDTELRAIITALNLQPIEPDTTNAPEIQEAIPQLGKQLFFAKNLGGTQSVACVSCHHPMLGGADELSLSVGVNAVDELDNPAHDLLGLGRFFGESDDQQVQNRPVVPRNAPTVFNLALNDNNIFWDGRIERMQDGSIITPDSPVDNDGNAMADTNLPADATIADAQARFPVTSVEEMRDDFLPGVNNQTLREALAGRLDNTLAEFSSTWPQAFEQAFGDSEVSVNRIAQAIGEYERSMLFVNSPWQRYLEGDNQALTNQQKRGAQLFFSFPDQGGAGCVACHNGPAFSDQRFHLVAFPQIGPGKGNNSGNGFSADFGRENVTGDQADRYHFRTPTLLNVSTSAPYGHAGTYETLEEVVRHYNNPMGAINRLLADDNADICQLPQFERILEKNNLNCQELYPDAFENSRDVVRRLRGARDGRIQATSPLPFNAGLNNQEVAQVVAFLNALTDPCTTDRDCMAPWIIDAGDEANFPDDKPLIAVDEFGRAL